MAARGFQPVVALLSVTLAALGAAAALVLRLGVRRWTRLVFGLVLAYLPLRTIMPLSAGYEHVQGTAALVIAAETVVILAAALVVTNARPPSPRAT